MRKDMFKVIVERPRHGGHCRTERRTPVDEDSPARESLRWRHLDRKGLNENLRPLERYLQRQVGRPWDKVYSELCAGIDRRSTVQQHIHEHIDDFVAVRVVLIDGEPHAPLYWGQPQPLAGRWARRFYVDPRSGLLRLNTWREAARRAWRQREPEEAGSRRELAPFLQLHRLEGLWYAIDLAPIPPDAGVAGVFDVVRRQRVASRDRQPKGKQPEGKRIVHCDPELYGKDDVYAWRKRQLGAAELRQHGLANDTQ